MGQRDKLIRAILSGTQDKTIRFDELCSLLGHLGFSCRIRGDHFIFTKDGIDEIINLQPKNGMAKPYQVKQVREIMVRYHLGGD